MKYTKIIKKAIKKTEATICLGTAEAINRGTSEQSRKLLRQEVLQDFEYYLDLRLFKVHDVADRLRRNRYKRGVLIKAIDSSLTSI